MKTDTSTISATELTANLLICGIGTITYSINEDLQALASSGKIAYHPFMGWASDIAMPAAYTAILMTFASQQTAKARAIIACSLASALTAYELSATPLNVPLGTAGASTYDPLDIACYWGASLGTFAITEYVHSGKMQEHISKAKQTINQFASKGLDNIVGKKSPK